MPTGRVQLAGVLLAEMVLRAGDIIAQRDTGRLKQTYRIVDPTYPDALGISVLFRPRANLDQLVLAGGPFPHNKVSFTIVTTL